MHEATKAGISAASHCILSRWSCGKTGPSVPDCSATMTAEVILDGLALSEHSTMIASINVLVKWLLGEQDGR